MKDVYTQILGISTIAAIVTAAVALLLMNAGCLKLFTSMVGAFIANPLSL